MWNIRRMCDWSWCQRKFGSLPTSKAEEECPIAGAGNLNLCYANVSISILLIPMITTSMSMHYEQYIVLYCAHINCCQSCIGDKVFKNGPSEFCERPPLKNLE